MASIEPVHETLAGSLSAAEARFGMITGIIKLISIELASDWCFGLRHRASQSARHSACAPADFSVSTRASKWTSLAEAPLLVIKQCLPSFLWYQRVFAQTTEHEVQSVLIFAADSASITSCKALPVTERPSTSRKLRLQGSCAQDHYLRGLHGCPVYAGWTICLEEIGSNCVARSLQPPTVYVHMYS